MTNILISPAFKSPDKADGGIRRVAEAQAKYLPEFGYTLVDSVEEADIIAVHAGAAVDVPVAKPLVAHCHGLYWEGYDWHRWHYLLNKQVIDVLLKADAVTSPSHWVDQALRRNFYLESTVLWHGVELDEWPTQSDGGEHDGYVLWNKARIDAVCDPTPVRELAKRAVTTEFVTTFEPEGAPSNVRAVPPQSYDDARRLVQRAGVYLCTTRETFGIGTLEAMASGVPILGWNFGGQAEFVRHKETGWLAPVGDYDSLAEGLAYCLKHRATLGRAARADVEERFQWRDVIGRYAKLYDATLARSAQAASSPRTSIIVTNYNLSQYLPRAINSVLAQTDQDYEIILIDDASTGDGERQAVQSLASHDARIRPILHEKNLYLAESLNDGLDHAYGRYILPLDADNEIAPDTLQILGDHLDGSREHDIAYGSVEFVRGEGELESAAPERFVSTWPPSEFDFRAQLAHKNQIPSTALYRRRVAERVGGYRPRCRTAEDADFWCRATSYGARPAKVTDAVTLIYHDRQDSMSHVNPDWPWDAWYTWGRRWELTPPGAPLAKGAVPAALIEGVGRGVLHAADPLVSIIIPVGPGHERKVIDALDSIQAQTLTSWECIVVNDTDAKLPWTHPWVRIVTTLGKFGPARARNAGMVHVSSTSRYFIFLDADDYLEPEALERMLTVALRSDSKDFIYTDWIIDEERRTVASNEWDPKSLLRKLDYPVTALYPIAAWKDSGGFDESYTVAWEDWDYALRIANAGYCGLHLPEALLHYRMSLGTRREAGFARRDELKSIVYEKWKPYIEGQKELMACGSCGKRSAVTPPALSGASPYRSAGASAPATISPDAVLLEYTGDNIGPLTFIGKATGTKYRFGLDADHRVRYVRGADVAGLLAFGDSFKLAEGAGASTPALVTA